MWTVTLVERRPRPRRPAARIARSASGSVDRSVAAASSTGPSATLKEPPADLNVSGLHQWPTGVGTPDAVRWRCSTIEESDHDPVLSDSAIGVRGSRGRWRARLDPGGSPDPVRT